MTYTKLTWAATTRVSAENLNHLETQYDAVMSTVTVWNNHDSRYYPKNEAIVKFYSPSFMGSGSGADADLLDGHHAAELIGTGLPVGSIVWWSKDSSTIPAGWYLCNGGNGTNDYRNKFIVGASASYSLRSSYGAATVTPTSYAVTIGSTALDSTTIAAHTHTFTETHGQRVQVFTSQNPSGGTGSYWYYSSTTSSNATGYIGSGNAHTHSGSTVTFNSEANIPPYVGQYLIKRMA